MATRSEHGEAAGVAVGVDVGASLAKVARRGEGGELALELLPAGDIEGIARRVHQAGAAVVGVTGAGAAELSRRLEADPVAVNEFAAWGAGARHLLERTGTLGDERILLVSLGTGTSVMLVDGLAVQRMGGTALGGGTLIGLGRALLGTGSFAELTGLAAKGDRRRVDLLVSDIYRPGEIALAGDLTAANFGKLDRSPEGASRPDLAHALMGLVGENVALICAGLGGALGVRRFVFAGSTLRENEPLVAILEGIARATGAQTTFLEDGAFAGALGALLLAAGEA